MGKIITLSLLIVLFSGCQDNKNQSVNNHEYKRWVGDIDSDPSVDDPQFIVCNGDSMVYQYFNTGAGPLYPDEKPAVEKIFQGTYKPVYGMKQNGMIRIRFIVNCNGEAGRFRLLESDVDYNPFKFDERVTRQLIDITSKIKNWPILNRDGSPLDYYFYLIFKLEDGQIKEILP